MIFFYSTKLNNVIFWSTKITETKIEINMN